MTPAFDPTAQDQAIRRWRRGVVGFMASTTGMTVGTGFLLQINPSGPVFLASFAAVCAFLAAAAVSLVYIAVGGVDMDIQAERRDRVHGTN